MDELRRLQLTELEILNVIDSICRKNDIEYSLYAGTLLGAVRHKGFIPWDDDLDICMSRENYNRFIQAWNNDPVDGYLLQNKDNSPRFTQSFSKIRKDGTTFFQDGEIPYDYHMGIFVDIFPIDRIPNGKFKRNLFVWRCMKYQLYTREYAPTQNGTIIKMISKLILLPTSTQSRKRKREKLLKKITENDKNKNLSAVGIELFSTIKSPLPADLLDAYIGMEFEGCKFKCVKKWDEYLTVKYGKYMDLPPKEDRVWKHLPLIIDFEHNFEDLNIDK